MQMTSTICTALEFRPFPDEFRSMRTETGRFFQPWLTGSKRTDDFCFRKSCFQILNEMKQVEAENEKTICLSNGRTGRVNSNGKMYISCTFEAAEETDTEIS